MPKTGIERSADYAVVIAAVTAATLALGSVIYQVTGGGHVHGAGLTSQAVLGVTTDAIGTGLLLLVGVQMMLGYHLFRLGGASFRLVHSSVGWTVLGLASVHGAAAVVHTLAGVEPLLVLLDAVGIAVLPFLAMQLASGYRSSARHTPRARRLHAAVAVLAAVIVTAHAVGGIVHTLAV